MPCLDCGCPSRGRTRCARCAGNHDRARGTTGERGYDADHQAEREAWRPYVEAGGVDCRRCRLEIEPGTPWDLGHPDATCPAPRAPEHRRCNRGATAALR